MARPNDKPRPEETEKEQDAKGAPGTTEFRPPDTGTAPATEPGHTAPVVVEDEEPQTDRPGRPRDVRAGPGDAGASDRPELLPDNPQTERRRREARPLIVGLLIATVVIVGLLLLLG